MPLLPIGIGTNLDIDETTAREGAPVFHINCYGDRAQAVRRLPPRRSFATPPVDSIEQIYESLLLGVVLAFGSGKVFKVESDGTYAELTGAELGGGPVTACEDGTHIFFAANSRIHKTDGTTVEVIEQSPQGVTSLVMFGPFLCANGAPPVGDYVAGDTHYSDDKENGYATWEVFNNEYRADDLQAMVVLNHYLFCIGSQTIEVNFLNTGDAANPIGNNPAGSKDFGTPARYSVASDDEAIYLLAVAGGSRTILRMRGGADIDPIGIPLSLPLEKIERIDDARGSIVGFRGQNFYVLTFPTANVTISDMFFASLTIAYHIQDKTWSIWGEWNTTLARYDAFRGNCYSYIRQWGKKLLGGNDGVIYEIYENTDVDYAAEPKYTHRWRNNGKDKFTNGRIINIGKLGEYDTIRHIRMCGNYQTRQHEIEYSDASGFRMVVRTGNISWGSVSKEKRNIAYHHNIKAGTNDFIINYIEEELTR